MGSCQLNLPDSLFVDRLWFPCVPAGDSFFFIIFFSFAADMIFRCFLINRFKVGWLFGVYGFLALGFVLLIARYLHPDAPFNDRLMKIGFWSLNGGLVLMIVTSLLPIGIYQAHASITEGLWYARSEGFMQQDFLQTLRWIRTLGDLVFIVGTFCVFWQVFQMVCRRR